MSDMAALLTRLRMIVGDRGLLTDPADTAPYAEDWRRLYRGRTPAVVRPANTAELAAVVRACAAAGVADGAAGRQYLAWSAAPRRARTAVSWWSASRA